MARSTKRALIPRIRRGRDRRAGTGRCRSGGAATPTGRGWKGWSSVWSMPRGVISVHWSGAFSSASIEHVSTSHV
jgi:hypothetical protein